MTANAASPLHTLAMRGREPMLVLKGVAFVIDAAGALYHEASGLLVVSDLHLEKGSSYARRGQFVPPYDTRATLSLLGRVVQRFAPRVVIALGDSFHDDGGADRLCADDRAAILALQRGRDWIWVAGNHDPSPPASLGGATAREIHAEGLVFRHEPTRGGGEGEVAGHLHPAAMVRGQGGAVKRKCVASDGLRAILPAFGAYAGGLDLRDAAFTGLFDRRRFVAFALDRDMVYPVPARNCL